MGKMLGILILSFILTSLLIVPFIDFLYKKVKLIRQRQKTKDLFDQPTPIFDKLSKMKVGTPFGGGILIIVVTALLSLWAYGIFEINVNVWEFVVLLFTLISFGILGLYDDLKKLANGKNHFFGLRFRHKFIIQWILAFIIGIIFYTQLGYDFIFLHGLGVVTIGALFIPLAAFIIVSFVNAFNITDGLDGLSGGLFLMSLGAFLIISSGILVDQFLGIFIAILMGAVASFLYFNIYPARIWLGDVGSLSLGAMLAVIGLLTGKVIALALIGAVFVVEVASSLIQIAGKKYLGRKLLPVAPFHLYLQSRGWEEPKIVMRLWLAGFLFAILGLWLATF